MESVESKVTAGCQVLGLRYGDDPAVGTRFDTLRRELGDNFIAVEWPQARNLTENRQQAAVDRGLAFFDEKLKTPMESAPRGRDGPTDRTESEHAAEVSTRCIGPAGQRCPGGRRRR